MLLLYAALSIGTIGKLILGIAVLRVHSYILKEHTIDDVVLRAMRRERSVTIFGIVFIFIGYLLEMYFYAHTVIVL